MLLHFGIFSFVLFTSLISESLGNSRDCDTLASVQVCLANKGIEIQVSPDDLTCQASEVTIAKVRDDYTHTPGIGYHKFHAEAKKWNEARKICMQEGGHLAIINSQAEERILADKLNKENGNIYEAWTKDQAWIGGHNLFGKDDWVTLLGESLSSTGYVHWSPGEPNNSGGNEHCLALYSKTGMNDSICDCDIAFICEIPDPCS